MDDGANDRFPVLTERVDLMTLRKGAKFLTATAAALTVLLAGCSGGGGAASPAAPGGDGAKEPYKVGVLVALTGSYAALGVPEKQSVELYMKNLNESGGINGHPVELVVADTASNEGNAVNQLRKLVTQDQVHAVIGPSSSGESVALRPFSKQLKTPVIALASAEAIVQPADEASYMFKEFLDTKLSLKAQMQYAKDQGWTKVALLSTNNGYGQDAANSFDAEVQAAGLELVGKEVFNADATDVTAQLSKLGSANPDVVMVWAVNPANAVVAKTAATLNFGPAIFHSPGAGSPDYIKNAGDTAEGTILQGSKVLAYESMGADDKQKAVTQALVDAYQAAHNEAPGQYAANGWDGAIILEAGLKQIERSNDVQATRDALRDALENKTKGLVGVNAIYDFTPDYHGPTTLTGLAVLGVENGKFVVKTTY